MVLFVFCKQKTAYEMRISDWISDVCSADLHRQGDVGLQQRHPDLAQRGVHVLLAERAAARQLLEDAGKPFLKAVEHRGRSIPVSKLRQAKRTSSQCATLADWRGHPPPVLHALGVPCAGAVTLA